MPGPAHIALATGVRRLDDDPLAFSRPRSADATHFVAKYEWILHAVRADATVFEPM